MMGPIPANQSEDDNMQPPPNRAPSGHTVSRQDGDADAPPLAPDSSASSVTVDSFLRLFESVPAEKFSELFKSQDLDKFENAFKSGDRSEIEKLVASSDSQKIFSLMQAGSSRIARSTSIGTEKFLPGIFESKDWASSLAPSHVDVDPAAVFKSEDSVLPTAVTNDDKGTDWNAMYEADLPGVSVSAPLSAASSDIEQTKRKGTDWNALYEGKLPDIVLPQPVPRITRSSSVEQTNSQRKTAVPATILKSDPVLPNAVLSQQSMQALMSGSRKRSESTTLSYVEPTPLDCLLGRGGRTNHNLGNQKYLAAKKEIQPRYLAASKQDKTGISQELVDRVNAWGGRFLELDPVTNKWFEVSALKARKKASQTLRELNTPEERAAKRARYGK